MISLFKKKNDESNYYFITLKNNLKVFIINDPFIKNSAVNIRYNVGYHNDDFPGQAHLLEHILLKFCKLYEINYFKKFINQNNGYSNAHTKSDHTTYYYSISNNKLLESLDILLDHIKNPLFDINNMNGEIMAVNAEHEKNKIDDDKILYNLFKQICNPLAIYFKKFSTGNKDTIIIDQLKDFYHKYYFADIMTIGIVSNKPIYDILTVIKKFNSIPSNKNIIINFDKVPFIDKPKIIHLFNEKSNELIVFFEINSYFNDYTISPIRFFNVIFNSKYNDSLFDKLYKLSYITHLNANVYVSNNNTTIYNFHFILTNDTVFDNVINYLFNYIDFFIKNIDLYNDAYDDYYNINIYNLTYFVKNNSLQRIGNLVDTYYEINIDPKNILIKDKYLKSFNDIKYYILLELSKLNPNNCFIIKKVIKHEINENMKIINYYENSKYNIKDFIFKPEYSLSFGLIKSNNLVSFDKKLLEKIKENIKLVYNKNGLIIKKQINVDYKTPNVFISVNVSFDTLTLNKNKRFILWFYLNYQLEYYYNYIYKIEQGNYDINFNIKSLLYSNEINIYIYGNYKNINYVYDFIIDKFLVYKPMNDFFINQTKNNILFNINQLKQPYVKCINKFYNLIFNKYIDNKFILDNINNVDMVIKFDFTLNILLIGNVYDFIIEKIIKKSINQTYFKINKNKKKVKLFIPNNEIIKIYRNNDNLKDTNNASVMNVYITNSFDRNYYFELLKLFILDKYINQLFINTIRIKEKFGYIVKSYVNEINIMFNVKYLYYTFVIQSPNKNYSEINLRLNKFINEIIINETLFESIKDTIINEQKFNNNLLDYCINILNNYDKILKYSNSITLKDIFDIKNKLVNRVITSIY